MSRPIKRPAPTAPALTIEDQAAQIHTARQHADAAHADASTDLDAALAAYAATPTADAARAYAAAYALHIGARDLAMQLRAHEAEIAEALAAHRKWEEARPAREAAEAEAARRRATAERIWNDPRNAERILAEALSAEAARHPFGALHVRVTLTDEMLQAGLERYLRRGHDGEPRYVAHDPEAWAAFLRKHARNLDGHSELVLNQIRRLTSEVAPVSDSISLSSASALAPNFSSPSTGGIRR